jgi:hypothetical protein
MRFDLHSLRFHLHKLCLVDGLSFTPGPQFYEYPRHNRFLPGKPGEPNKRVKETT